MPDSCSCWSRSPSVDPEFRQLRLNRGQAFAKRNSKWVKKLQDEGFADPSLDSDMSAKALSLMVGRMAYLQVRIERTGLGH